MCANQHGSQSCLPCPTTALPGLLVMTPGMCQNQAGLQLAADVPFSGLVRDGVSRCEVSRCAHCGVQRLHERTMTLAALLADSAYACPGS